jgi:hypothetical protein
MNPMILDEKNSKLNPEHVESGCGSLHYERTAVSSACAIISVSNYDI